MDTSERHVGVGAFLKRRRELLHPDDVGLPAGTRRHVKGLRREEVAELIGISPSYYAFIEQGRPRTISAAVVRKLANVLRLDPVETDHLYALLSVGAHGDEQPPRRHDGGVECLLRFTVERMTGVSATLVDGWANPLYWNSVSDAIHQYSSRSGLERNNAWRIFFDPWMKALHAPDWDKATRIAVSSLRRRCARDQSDGHPVGLLRELELSADFRRVWRQYDVTPYPDAADHPSFDELRLNHPVAGRLAVASCVLTLPYEPDLFLWVRTPIDNTSAERLRQLDHLIAGTPHLMVEQASEESFPGMFDRSVAKSSMKRGSPESGIVDGYETGFEKLLV